MRRPLLPLPLMLLSACLTLAASSACDDPEAIAPPPGVVEDTPVETLWDKQPEAELIPDDTEQLPVPARPPGLGEEDPSRLIEPGTLNGTWRIGLNDTATKAPVMHVDFVHDRGAAEAECDFIMFGGLAPNFADKVGRCQSVTINGDTLMLTFNPTEKQDYTMTLQTTSRPDADTFVGQIQGGKDRWDVLIERRTLGENGDGVRPIN